MTTVTSVFTKQKGPQWHGHPASRALGFPNLQGWAPGLHLNLSVQQRRQPQCLSQNAMVCETGTEPWQPECSPQGSQTPLRLEKNLCLSGMRWPSRVQISERSTGPHPPYKQSGSACSPGPKAGGSQRGQEGDVVMGMRNSLTWTAVLGKFHSTPYFPPNPVPTSSCCLLPFPTTATSFLLLCPETLRSQDLLSIPSTPTAQAKPSSPSTRQEA